METLIKSKTNTMKEMMLIIKDNKSPTNPTKQTDKEKKKKKKDKKRKKCGKKHPSKAKDDCWELEKNKESRPLNWKSSKST
jgi:hypothetical protein